MTDTPRPEAGVDRAAPAASTPTTEGNSSTEPTPIERARAASTTDDDRRADRPGREPGDLVVALSPRQIIGGFAVLAGLIVMLRRRRRDRD